MLHALFFRRLITPKFNSDSSVPARWAYGSTRGRYIWLGNWDYAGIAALIVGSCYPIIFYGFGPELATHRLVYLVALAALGLTIMSFSFTSWFDRMVWTRIGLYVALGLTGMVAMAHSAFAHNFSPATVAALKGVVVQTGGTYGAGIGFYASRFPESLPDVSGRFDIVGSSHNWWHVCVLMAAYQHFGVVLELWRSTAVATVAATAATA